MIILRTIPELRARRASLSWAPGTLTGAALALFALVIYLATLSPAVNTLDGGELAASAATLGVAHPTGYPLFLLVSRAFIILFPAGTVIWKLNLLMALFGAASVFLFHRLFLFLLRAFPGGRIHENLPGTTRVAAASATLILAFTRTYWNQAVAYEVYSFQVMLLAVLLSLYMSALHKSRIEAERTWALFSLALGLSLTNHMTTVLLVPPLLYYHFALRGPRATALRAAKSLPLVLVGLSAYLYLPLRASVHPLMNWSDPSTLENFLWHVQGKQFWRHMFYSGDLALWKLRLFVEAFPAEFGYLPPLLALPGLAFLARREKKLLVFTLLLFVLTVVYAINYGITDIESYFVTAYVAVAIWIAFGLRAVAEFAKARFKTPLGGRACVAFSGLLVLFPLALNYAVSDLRGMYSAQDYVKNVLESAEPGGVVFTDTDGRHTIAFYLQLVEGVRPDVALIDKGWLEYPYYAAQLKQRFPWLKEALRLETAGGPGFNKPYPVENVTTALRALVAENISARAFYFTYNFPPDFFPGFPNIPTGLAFRLYPGNRGEGRAPAPGPVRPFSFRPFPRSTEDTREVENYYALGYLNQGSYRLWLGEMDAGIFFLERALTLRPGFAEARNLLYQARAEQARLTRNAP